MRLRRNEKPKTAGGGGKYAVIKLDVLDSLHPDLRRKAEAAMLTLQAAGVLIYGDPKGSEEFFVIFLKDRFASAALNAYAREAMHADPEYADDVMELANRSGIFSKFCKMPD